MSASLLGATGDGAARVLEVLEHASLSAKVIKKIPTTSIALTTKASSPKREVTRREGGFGDAAGFFIGPFSSRQPSPCGAFWLRGEVHPSAMGDTSATTLCRTSTFA